MLLHQNGTRFAEIPNVAQCTEHTSNPLIGGGKRQWVPSINSILFCIHAAMTECTLYILRCRRRHQYLVRKNIHTEIQRVVSFFLFPLSVGFNLLTRTFDYTLAAFAAATQVVLRIRMEIGQRKERLYLVQNVPHTS